MPINDPKLADAALRAAELQRAVEAAQWELTRLALAQGRMLVLIGGVPTLPPPPSPKPR